MNKKNILYVLLSLLISSSIFLVGYQKTSKPVELYRVYLKGETIGYIKSKEVLEEYIDNEQVELKEKYKVDIFKRKYFFFSLIRFLLYLC